MFVVPVYVIGLATRTIQLSGGVALCKLFYFKLSHTALESSGASYRMYVNHQRKSVSLCCSIP